MVFKGISTPLESAVIDRNLEIVRLLLKHKADPNKATSPDKLPLGLAVKLKSVEMVRILLDHGADPMLKVRDHAIQDYAIFQGNQEIIDLITQARLKRIKDRRKKKKAA